MVKRKGSECGDTDHPDATFVMTRAEDRSVWMRFSYLAEKYKLIVWVIASILVSAGYGFQTPRAANAQIRAGIDSTNARVAALETYALAFSAMVRIKCVELQEKPDVLQVAGIDCQYWMTTKTPTQK